MKLSSTQWSVALGAMTGAVVSLMIAHTRQLDEAIDQLRDLTKDLRVPDPGYAMQLPVTREEFIRLDDLLCECLAVASDSAADIVVSATACAASRLYPEFQWPPISGDHPTVAELWQTLHMIAKRQVALAACSTP